MKIMKFFFDGSRPNYDKKKKTTFVGGSLFLEREKGLMAAPETLLAQGWLAPLRAFRLRSKS